MNRTCLRTRGALGALLCASFLSIAMTGCGGGGDDAPATAYPLAAAYASFVTDASSTPVTSAGTIQGVNYTASGTISQNAAQASTFEGMPVVSNTRTLSITATAQGQTQSTTSSSQRFISNGTVVGEIVPGNYSVVAGAALPASATIGTSGTLATAKTYASSAKMSVLATTTITYSLDAGPTPDSAILRLNTSGTATSGVSIPAKVTLIRITAAGTASLVSDQVDIAGSTVTLTAQ